MATTRTRSSTCKVDGPAVPLAVWPVAQSFPRQRHTGRYPPEHEGHPGELMPALAARIIAEYTSPGQLIVDPTCGLGITLVEAATRDRRAIGVELDVRRATLALNNCEQVLTPEQCLGVDVRVGDAMGLPTVLYDAIGQVDLVIVSAPDGHPWTHRPADAMAAIFAGCHLLLRPGGLLVTVTENTRRRGCTFDLAGTNVRLARVTGFTYVQHVIALHAAIRDGQLAASPSRAQVAHVRRARRRGDPVHFGVHDDVLVFRAEKQVGR